MLIASPFIAYNLITHDSLLTPYYLPQRLSGDMSSTFVEAMVGNLISPGRGLFIFSPILLFSFYGIYKSLKKPRTILLYLFMGITIFIHWIAISKFPHWWAGHSYGPRFFADMMPFFAILLVPFFKDFIESANKKHVLLIVGYSILVSWSLFINFKGANCQEVYDWNIDPVNVDEAPYRIWDWSDPQFLR